MNNSRHRPEGLNAITDLLATVSEVSFGEGWDTEEIEIADEDLVSKDAKSLMNEAKAGNLDQLQAPAKVRKVLIHSRVLK